METVYLYALAANLVFAVGVQFYTHYARKVSSLWVNAFKALVGALLFAATALLQGGFTGAPAPFVGLFLLSGGLGLGLADLFMIKAFSLMGPGRTMMLFGVQPVVIGALSWLAFGQTLEPRKAAAVLFFIVCLYIFSLESFRRQGHWNLKASFYALCAICFDACGVIITRYAFNHCPGLGTTEGNLYRALGALLLFAVLSRFKPIDFLGGLRRLDRPGLLWITVGSVCGTYLSLMFYLSAIRYAGALAVVSGIGITGTLFASLFECAAEKRLPSRYMAAAFVFFLGGVWMLFG